MLRCLGRLRRGEWCAAGAGDASPHCSLSQDRSERSLSNGHRMLSPFARTLVLLGHVLLAAELAESLRDETLFREKAHERDRKRSIGAVRVIEVLLGDVLGELLRMSDLAHGDLAVRA